MTKIIVADTGPLIALALLELLPRLPTLFSVVYVPDGVAAEALQDSGKPGAQAISQAFETGWIVRRTIDLSDVYLDLVTLLDQGEAQALALAEQLEAIALIDERRGRKVAALRGIKVTGTAAVLIHAKTAGEIPAVKPLLDRLAQHGYRLSSSLIRDVLRLAGESTTR